MERTVGNNQEIKGGGREMTEYFTKEEVLGVIQGGINSYDDIIKREMIYTRARMMMEARREELLDLYRQFSNRISVKL